MGLIPQSALDKERNYRYATLNTPQSVKEIAQPLPTPHRESWEVIWILGLGLPTSRARANLK
ncbi:MAG: hypothetical protein Q6J46_04960 [Thermostichus sp. DG02_2_bins_29]